MFELRRLDTGGVVRRYESEGDEMPIRSAAMHILRRAGYQVEAAVDGFDALERLRHTPADAVLLDIKMPLLDGFGFLQAYRADHGLAPAGIVLMSADDQAERRGPEMGGSTFVRRPFAVADLVDALKVVPGQRQQGTSTFVRDLAPSTGMDASV